MGTGKQLKWSLCQWFRNLNTYLHLFNKAQHTFFINGCICIKNILMSKKYKGLVCVCVCVHAYVGFFVYVHVIFLKMSPVLFLHVCMCACACMHIRVSLGIC